MLHLFFASDRVSLSPFYLQPVPLLHLLQAVTWACPVQRSCVRPAPQSLLCDPNPNSPANSEAARLYNENRREYNRRVKEVVEASWLEQDA